MLVVISGGSQGLGFALAQIYTDRGCDVVLVARTESKLRSAVERLGPSADYVCADAQIPADCERVFAEVRARHGIPDLVLCCAGSAQPGVFVEMDSSDLTKNLGSVYLTAMHFSHAALRVLCSAKDKATKRRHLVYCSSTVAVFPFYGYSAYAPAKAAVRALYDVTRQECIPHNVRVSLLLPGTMDTEGYAVEELTKPAPTKKIEGPSQPISASEAAQIVVRELDNGHDVVYTDTIGWVLGSMMLGVSPRAGLGLLQTLVGFVLVLLGPVVRRFIDADVPGAPGTKPKQG